jgi:predicted RNase H-like nuclease (RuvC/YqgF family)
MGTEPDPLTWPSNYFNYFTEIEEHFQRARGTSLFLLSPVDWALVETWKNAGVPLEAVLRGIDAAFEKWRSRKKKLQKVNSLTYCSQEVLKEAQDMAGVQSGAPAKRSEAPFTLDQLQAYLAANVASLTGQVGFEEIAAGLERLAAESETLYRDLEQMEQRLAALEEKMIAIARTRQSEDNLFRARRELGSQLRSYRSKMSAEQIAMLEKQYLERQLLESSGLPRLSLFYML